MAPPRKSRSVNKRFSASSEVSPEKDGVNSIKNKLRKKKLTDKLGSEWSKEELEQFYQAYRKYDKDWKKVAAVVRNRSIEMVEALYNMNRAYLSLPEGTASVVGLIAMMTDHYNVLAGSDSGRESNDSPGSRKPLKRKIEKVQLSVSKDSVQSQSIASGDGCLSLLKKRRFDEVTPSQTKRSPRGCTELPSLKKNGKINVGWDEKGRPINSQGGVDLASYIGVATRHHFKITDSYWGDKSLGDKKQLIWEDLNNHFVLTEERIRYCIGRCGHALRQYRTDGGKLIKKSDGTPNYQVPKRYKDKISEEDWVSFVNYRMREEFKNLSEKNRKRASNPVYPYRASRASYRGVEEKILNDSDSQTSAVELDVVWLNARKNKYGVIDNERVQGAANRVAAIKQSTDTPNSFEVLDKALELPEYPGRVRGVGYGVPKDHFLPKNKRRRFARVALDEFEARIREETKAEVAGLYAKVDSCMKKIEELQRQQHGNAANAPSSCLNENPTQASQIIPGVESPQIIPGVESPQVIPGVESPQIIPGVESPQVIPRVESSHNREEQLLLTCHEV